MLAQKKRPGAMGDAERYKVVEQYMTNACFEGMYCPWEYIGITVRKGNDILLKHMDHKNDAREGYQHMAVYSYLYKWNGEVYRVTLVLTFRQTVGSLVQKKGD